VERRPLPRRRYWLERVHCNCVQDIGAAGSCDGETKTRSVDKSEATEGGVWFSTKQMQPDLQQMGKVRLRITSAWPNLSRPLCVLGGAHASEVGAGEARPPTVVRLGSVVTYLSHRAPPTVHAWRLLT